MPALSAVVKPFSPESDPHILFLTQKFIFLEQLYIPAMQSKNSASLLIQLQTSFNLLFEEQKLYLSTADMSNSSVTNISPSFVTSPHFNPAISINSSNSNNLTSRKLKKQQRGAIWKLKKLSTDPMKLQPQTVLANPDLVSESSSSSNQIFNHSKIPLNQTLIHISFPTLPKILFNLLLLIYIQLRIQLSMFHLYLPQLLTLHLFLMLLMYHCIYNKESILEI